MYQAKNILTYRCKIQCLASLFFRQIKYSNQDVCSCHSIMVTLLKLFPVSNQILSKKYFNLRLALNYFLVVLFIIECFEMTAFAKIID